jgi:putative FmdB family regulatory protein
MPEYEFQCTQCGKEFIVEESIKEYEEHEEKHDEARCPKCGSTNVERRFSAVFVKTSRKA